jgi:hypothetical protein
MSKSPNDEVELVNDGEGLAILGDLSSLEKFLHDSGLEKFPSQSLDMHRISSLLVGGSTAAQLGSEFANRSGRWVKLTTESAEAVKQYGFMSTKTAGISHAMIGKPGKIKQWVNIEKAPKLLRLSSILACLPTIMQQAQMQQQINEITAYLDKIDAKIDDILRNQEDTVFSEIISAHSLIEEAFIIRGEEGHISETEWSKLQTLPQVIVKTQTFAERQLEAAIAKTEKPIRLSENIKETNAAEPDVRKWLAVLAYTLQLQDGITILELDHVLTNSPDYLESHRHGLNTTRQKQLDSINQTVNHLLENLCTTAEKANSQVLFHPHNSPSAISSKNNLIIDINAFLTQLGIESKYEPVSAKGWNQAAREQMGRLTNTLSETKNRSFTIAKDIGFSAKKAISDASHVLAATSSGESLKSISKDKTNKSITDK